MPSTTFTDGVTKVVASWLNPVNTVIHSLLGDGTNAPTTKSQLRSNMGATAVGDAVLTAASTDAAQTSLGGTTVGKALFTSGSISSAFASVRVNVASAATINLTSLAPNTQHINITGSNTITGFTVDVGVYYFVRFDAILTLTNNASIVTQTGANIITEAGDTCILRATAANTVEVLCYASSKIKLATAVTLTNQTNVDFGSLPSWVKRINILASGVSTNGTSAYLVQLGDIGGFETSGYSGSAGGTNFTSGFIWSNPGSAAAVTHATLQLQRITGNTWAFCGNAALSSSAAQSTSAGTKTLSDTGTAVRITTVSGTDQFDAGTVNISYE